MNSSMWNFFMAFPTATVGSVCLMAFYPSSVFRFRYLIYVATNTVVLHYFYRCWLHKNHIRFCSSGKNRCVVQPIFCLKVVRVHNIVVGHVAIVTRSPLTVRAMVPTIVHRGHVMTVHTSLGIIRQIRNHLGLFHNEKPKPKYRGYCKNCKSPPTGSLLW